MKRIRPLLVAVLTLALCFALGACGSDSEEQAGAGSTLREFDKLVFEDAEYTYDGTEKKITVQGHPAATITYSPENAYTDAGVYKITATATQTGYNPKTVTATLTIKPAVYDMSRVALFDKTVTYDGTIHGIEIFGTLPEGVSVSYEGGGTDVGEYTVTAHFTGDGKNYEPIPDMTATLTIMPPNVSDVTFKDAEFVYDGTPKSIEISGTLPEGVRVEYEGNGVTDAGEYTVKAKFISDSGYVIPDLTATITVKKAVYDMSGVTLSDKTVTYNKEAHSVEISGTLPEGVSVSYEGGGTDAGEYTVTAHFTGDVKNYEPIPDLTATVTVKKAVYDMSGVTLSDKTVTYNGEPCYIDIAGTLPEGVSVRYEGNGKVEAGEYSVTAYFTGDGKNYEPIPNMTATLTIKRSDISVSFNSAEFVYDGTPKSIEISGTLPSDVTVEYLGNGVTDAGEYEVIAKFVTTGNYENLPDLKAVITIKRAVYDMSGISFTDKTVNYDGNEHSVEITGTLPTGVSVNYIGGGVSDVGTYNVVARFTGDGKNYEPIPDMTATLTVDGCVVKLMINDTHGATVVGDDVVSIPRGSDVEFTVKLRTTYEFVSVSVGIYDAATGKLSLDNVSESVTVNFNVRELEYDPNDTVRVQLKLSEGDSASVKSGAKVNHGSQIELSAADSSRNFIGWSIGDTLENGGILLSRDKYYVLSVVPSVIGENNGMITLYSNYKSLSIVYYDPNGGTVNTESVNMKGNSYYTAVYNGEMVTVTHTDAYMNYAESVSAFWDDGTFVRDGYVLIEYNTSADGNGEAYSLGSKFYTGSTPYQTLYCIWAEATPASDFEYTDVKWGYASGIDATKAPNWKVDGVKITKYNGDAEWVVIPEMIDGKYVTTIDTGAFVDKGVKVLVFNKYILRVEDGAFKNCGELATVYMNDSIFYMNDAALDIGSYRNLKNFYLNATMAPRFTQNDGAFAVKLSRLLASQDENRVIVVSGSSTYQGLGTPYLEALLDGDYTVINMGTTRTGTGMIFFEALQHYTHEGDIVVYAPENHVNMFGNNVMWYRSFYDTEGMYNLFRYIDISHYPSAFSALSAYNKERRYTKNPCAYEDIVVASTRTSSQIDKYGDYQKADRGYYREDEKIKYIDSYFITLNEYYKNDLLWSDVEYQTANKDYLTSNTWTDFTMYNYEVNRAIALIKETGATVTFGFAPVDADDVVPEAQNKEWLSAYDKLILDYYDFDALLGSSADYVFAHTYFYDCAYHVNDYGRTYRTYQMYLDLCELLGIKDVKAIDAVGTNFKGCLFEASSDGTPVTKVEYLQ